MDYQKSNIYRYLGVVKSFDKVISKEWSGETRATSEKAARNNLAYQYKRSHNLTPATKITLQGKLEIVGGE